MSKQPGLDVQGLLSVCTGPLHRTGTLQHRMVCWVEQAPHLRRWDTCLNLVLCCGQPHATVTASPRPRSQLRPCILFSTPLHPHLGALYVNLYALIDSVIYCACQPVQIRSEFRVRWPWHEQQPADIDLKPWFQSADHHNDCAQATWESQHIGDIQAFLQACDFWKDSCAELQAAFALSMPVTALKDHLSGRFWVAASHPKARGCLAASSM